VTAEKTAHRTRPTAPGDQRLVLTIDIPEGPANEKLAIDALIAVVRHFEFDAIYPTFMALELGYVLAGR
jgi:hypothetical protein